MEIIKGTVIEVDLDTYTVTYSVGARSETTQEAFFLLNQPPDKSTGAVPGLVIPEEGTTVYIMRDEKNSYVLGYPLHPEMIHSDILTLTGKGEQINVTPTGTMYGVDNQGNFSVVVSDMLRMSFKRFISLWELVASTISIKTLGGSFTSSYDPKEKRSKFSWFGYKKPLAATMQDAVPGLRPYTSIELGGIEDSDLTMKTTTFSPDSSGALPDTLIEQKQGRQEDDVIKQETISVGPVEALATKREFSLKFLKDEIVRKLSHSFMGVPPTSRVETSTYSPTSFVDETVVTPSITTSSTLTETVEDGDVATVRIRKFDATTTLTETVDNSVVKWEIEGAAYASTIIFDVTSGKISFEVDKATSFEVTGPKSVLIEDNAGSKIEVNEDNVIVDAVADATFTVGGNATMTVTGNVEMVSSGNIDIQSDGNTSVTVTGNVAIEANGNADVIATGAATVKGATVTVDSPAVTITGGTLSTNGAAAPTGDGPYCALPTCLFTGAPHVGNNVAGT